MARRGLRSASFGSPVTLRFPKSFEDHLADLTSRSIERSLSEIEAEFDNHFGPKSEQSAPRRRRAVVD